MYEQFLEIINNPLSSLAIIGNLIIIESLLSVDNAAVLATMVMDLPKEQRQKALRYGIIGAYFFRGLCLLFAAFLIQIWWLKPLGGLYLLFLVFNYFRTKSTPDKSDDLLNKKEHWFYKATLGWMNQFWATVALVELMDLAFSIDNVFAVVAFTENLILIWTGVFIGILAMRFVAQWFVKLMGKYPFLEPAAFLVIAVLGLKLVLSVYEHFRPGDEISKFLSGHTADWMTSLITVLIFVVPIITSLLFNYPRHAQRT
ncbi:membrane protein [Adhaeribacter aerolatus]|uniref:Membrane protein n=1 Tax=Adhaeribacter aerolatus TaxID=670289 RepID=A0A512B3V6_9BACT|nr:TerC family protein [Adhaeribacter aerolatus]GEO06644.1 membrane protein [Adhaeribacter aerolatus]